ncbi:MAG: SPOR domain-containing protein [Syntrophobacterales bacterium]|jgi:cell division septation protein DedD|nr:SPOR domain-containing protein [Syntrophobacterales bacterium]
MKRFTGFGLALLAGMVIIIVILVRLYFGGSPKPGPATVTAPAPPAPTAAAPQPAPTPTPAPASQATPTAPLTVQPGPPQSAPAETKVAPLPPLQPEKQHGFLAGTFHRYRDAAKLLDRLKKQGKPGFIRRDPANGHRFQVWVGPFDTPHEAAAAKKSLRRHLKRTPKIEAIENPVPK